MTPPVAAGHPSVAGVLHAAVRAAAEHNEPPFTCGCYLCNAVRAIPDRPSAELAASANQPELSGDYDQPVSADGHPCPTCNGSGFVLASDWYGDDWTGLTDADIPCPECQP